MGRASRLRLTPKAKPPAKVELEPYQKAVNEAAARVRGLWLGFIALLAYLFVAVGAVTHRDLLLQSPVKLPLLDVNLPLVGFFAVAPALLLINHFYLLLQLLGLGRRLEDFRKAIDRSSLDENGQKLERRKLDTFVIVQMIGGTIEERGSWNGVLLRSITFITLVAAPVTLLLFIQLQFLPYQDWLATWIHRIALAIDLFMVWRFWPSIKRGDWAPLRSARVGGIASILLVLFSLSLMTFPGEAADTWRMSAAWEEPEDSQFSNLKRWLFGDIGRQRAGGKFLVAFSRALELPDNTTLIDLDKFDKINKRHKDNNDNLKPWEKGRTLDLRGRILRGATFDRSDFRNVDFFQAHLQSATLKGARLQGAQLSSTNLQRALLDNANLWGANLDKASLQGASLKSAKLHGASLEYSQLHGATLENAHLQGATLDGAHLHGASLAWAKLQGASLIAAHLFGASLEGANLQGANLVGTLLNGASLKNTRLQGVIIETSILIGANLIETFLWRVYGTPRSQKGILVRNPNLAPLTVEEVSELTNEAVADVESTEVEARIRDALARISDPTRIASEYQLPLYPSPHVWETLAKTTDEDRHFDVLVDILIELACKSANASHVAKGLMHRAMNEKNTIVTTNSRLEELGSRLPGVAKRLLDAAESDDCPGVSGLDDWSIAELQRWAGGQTIRGTGVTSNLAIMPSSCRAGQSCLGKPID